MRQKLEGNGTIHVHTEHERQDPTECKLNTLPRKQEVDRSQNVHSKPLPLCTPSTQRLANTHSLKV